ncbi:hypothetical protein KCA1_2554 [Lactiplantibacillus pentosus KCA1]|nr:hypothetical protein [Lactiplantibacillus pentosus]EIW12850.1 hypothetical protein KCA1_2554 [Lactiplantibacillus pentosus KCA1]
MSQRIAQPYLDTGAIRAETLPISFIYRTDAVMAPPLECFIKQIKAF